jgi:predicted nuclease of restriction endonuclease-like (RecB) superfamily
MPELAIPEGYDTLLQEVRSLLATARNRAYQAVDNLRVQAYWQVGERLVRAELEHRERADYGHRVIERLAADLGMARRLLFEIVQFYRVYPLVHLLRAELSWSQYGVLMRVADARARTFYEGLTVRNGWSVRELEEQVRADLYGRSLRVGSAPSASAAPAAALRPEEAFRAVFQFEVPGLPAGFAEADLERALLANFERLVAELGPDFYLRRRQQPLTIDGQLHRVDLELYCRGIPTIVLVDLKIGAFEDRDVGQMNKYVTYYRERVPRYPWEKPPIGLIICAHAGQETVRYALGGLEEKIFVAEYRLKLPSEVRIREGLGLLGRDAGNAS